MDNTTKIAAGVGVATAVGMVVGATMLFSPDKTSVPDFLPGPTLAEDFAPKEPIVEPELETVQAQDVSETAPEPTPKVTTESIGPLPGEVEPEPEEKPTFTERVKKSFSKFLPKKKQAVAKAEPRAKIIRKQASIRYAKRNKAQGAGKDSLPLEGRAPNGVFAWELDRQIWSYRNHKNRN